MIEIDKVAKQAVLTVNNLSHFMHAVNNMTVIIGLSKAIKVGLRFCFLIVKSEFTERC